MTERDDLDWIYSSARWRHLRAQKLRRNPLCEDCKAMGFVRAATVVDHRHAISQGGDPFPPLDDLSSKCAPCHNAKTARSAEHGAAKTSKPRRGCNPDGTPLDPAHPWNDPGGSSTVGEIGRRKARWDNPTELISPDCREGRRNG